VLSRDAPGVKIPCPAANNPLYARFERRVETPDFAGSRASPRSYSGRRRGCVGLGWIAGSVEQGETLGILRGASWRTSAAGGLAARGDDCVEFGESAAQLGEFSGSELLFPFGFEVSDGLVDRPGCGTASGGEADALGALVVAVGFAGETVDIAPGEAVCVKRGQIHGFQNQGSVDARFLAIATPGVFGPAYFREIAEVLAASAGGPPDLAAIGEVMRRHGLTPTPPR
jgi:hypothetical protein